MRTDTDLEPATFHVAMKRREHSDRSLTASEQSEMDIRLMSAP